MADQWALDRVRQLVDAQTKPGWHDDHTPSGVANAFARYIEEHEEAPEDPLYEALKAVVELGRYDTREQTELLRGELRSRGLEIREVGKAQA